MEDEKIPQRVIEKFEDVAREKIIEALRRAGPEDAWIVYIDGEFEVLTGKPYTWIIEKDYIPLIGIEANWRANWSWTEKDVLGEEMPDEVKKGSYEDMDNWRDEKARELGYKDFDEALCEYMAEGEWGLEDGTSIIL